MSAQPAPAPQSVPEKIGIQSELTEVFRSEDGGALVRARFRIDNSAAPQGQQFRPGDWLDVTARARVYNATDVARRAALPESPRAEGPERQATARTEWSVVDLDLPPMPRGDYVVVAKVYSRDARYRRSFEPSNCYAFNVSYGFPLGSTA